MPPRIALALLLAASTGLAKGQNASDSIRDSYHIFFPAMGKDILSAHIGAHSYKIVNIYDKPAEVYVDDRKVPDDQLAKYAEVIQRIKTSVRDDDEEREMRQMARDRRQAGRDREQAARDRQQSERDRLHAERDRQRAGIDSDQQSRDREQQSRQREQRQREHAQQQMERAGQQREREQQRAEQRRDREQSQRERSEAQIQRIGGQRNHEGSSIYIETGNGDCNCNQQDGWDEEDVQQHREQSAEDRAMLKKGIQVLVEDHVIDNSQHLRTLVLTDTDLSVNGVKQPSNVYQQIRSRLGDWAHNGFSYGMTGSSEYSLSIND